MATRLRSVSLPAKLRPPRVRPDALRRDALLRHLAANADVPVLVVSGAAGSGKSTAIRQWLAQDGRPAAWVSVDVGDNDPVVLLRYVAAALDDLEPFPDDVRSALATADATAVGSALARALSPDRRPSTLVLDDTHLLTHPAAWACVAEIADLVPPGSQLVVSGRGAPRIDLARRRLDGSVLELGQDDLRFSADEARAVLATSGVALDAVAVDQVVRHTEGWPAGVYLAVLALQDHHDPVGLVDGIHGDHRLLAEYFRDELLRQLPDDLRRFLLRTSILERACGPLCDAVTGSTGSGTVLEELASSRNLFIVPLDHDRTWYRYHHLFGELLLSELRMSEPGLEPELRRRAATWYAANDDPGSAIDQALAVPDLDLAASIAAEQVFACATTGRYATLERWLQAFPPAEVHRRGPLLLAEGWCHLAAGRGEDLRGVLELADRAAVDGPLPDGTATFAVARAMLWSVSGTGGVERLAASSAEVAAAGPDGSPWWSFGVLLNAVARWLMGEPDPVAPMERVEFVSRAVPAVHAVATSHLALMRLRAGDTETGTALALAAAEELRANDIERSPLVFVAHAVHAEAAARLRRGDESRRAARVAEGLMATTRSIVPRAEIHARLVLGEAARRRGDLSEARGHLDRAERLLPEEPGAVVLHDWRDRLRHDLGASPADGPGERAGITDGERRVLEQLPTHLSLEEIGERLYVSRNTVKSHTVSIYRKLGVSSRGAAVERARAMGLLDG